MGLEAVVGKESSFFSLGSKLRQYALALSLLAFGYSCGNNQDNEEPTLSACASDSECKGSRICREGKCVDSSLEEGNGGYDSGTSDDSNADDDSAPRGYLDAGNHSVTDGGSSGNNQPRADAGSSGNEQPSCTSHATKACSENDVYWQDSCGNLEELFDDCDSNQYCNNAQCVNEEPQCSSHASKACHNGDVYWRDSCGNIEDLFDDCNSNEVCSSESCVEESRTCDLSEGCSENNCLFYDHFTGTSLDTECKWPYTNPSSFRGSVSNSILTLPLTSREDYILGAICGAVLNTCQNRVEVEFKWRTSSDDAYFAIRLSGSMVCGGASGYLGISYGPYDDATGSGGISGWGPDSSTMATDDDEEIDNTLSINPTQWNTTRIVHQGSQIIFYNNGGRMGDIDSNYRQRAVRPTIVPDSSPNDPSPNTTLQIDYFLVTCN